MHTGLLHKHFSCLTYSCYRSYWKRDNSTPISSVQSHALFNLLTEHFVIQKLSLYVRINTDKCKWYLNNFTKTKYKTGFQINHYFYIFNGHESECNDNRKQHFTLIGVKVNYVYRKEDTYVSICLWYDDISI